MERQRASTLGKQILLLRRDQRLKQKDLAAAVGIAPMTLSRLESGELQDLKGATVARIADKLGVSMDVLYGRDSERITSGSTNRRDNRSR